MKYQDFEEDWVCPYCKQELKKFIRVFEEEKHGEIRTSIQVSYGTAPIHNHRRYCREEKLMELANYHVQELDCCINCKDYAESSIYDKISDSEGSCTKFNKYVKCLGKCDKHERYRW